MFANFYKIFVQTDKTDHESAQTYIDYVIKTIKEQELFSYIKIEPHEFYKILLFKDYYNYGGIKESTDDKVSSRWDISMHLPQAIRRLFLKQIALFILKVYKHNQRLRDVPLNRGADAEMIDSN